MIRVMQRGKKYLLSVLLAALAIVLAVSGVGAVTAPPAAATPTSGPITGTRSSRANAGKKN